MFAQGKRRRRARDEKELAERQEDDRSEESGSDSQSEMESNNEGERSWRKDDERSRPAGHGSTGVDFHGKPTNSTATEGTPLWRGKKRHGPLADLVSADGHDINGSKKTRTSDDSGRAKDAGKRSPHEPFKRHVGQNSHGSRQILSSSEAVAKSEASELTSVYSAYGNIYPTCVNIRFILVCA